MSFWESMTVQTKKAILICVPVGVFCLLLGVIVGYFPGHTGTTSTTSPLVGSCDLTTYPDIGKKYTNSYIQKSSDSVCVHASETCNTYQLPRTYIAYHLNNKQIRIDGNLNDPAWQEVPWSQDFQDIRSSVYPTPRFQTKVKVRWDDLQLYIGAYMQETNVAAKETESDARVYLDNDFEVLVDVGGTMHNFKQIVINALGTTFDKEFYSSPYDETSDDTSTWSQGITWSAGSTKAVSIDGTLNNNADTDRSWSVELAFTFEALANHTVRTQLMPGTNEVWFANFGRAEYLKNPNDVSITTTGSGVDWWSWQPCGAVNLLLQNRWGLIQFKRDISDTSFLFPSWHIYKALFDVFEALKAYQGINGKYTDQLEELNMPPYLFSGACVELPVVQIPQRGGGFTVTVKSKIVAALTGQIRSDRFVFLMNS